MNGTESANSLSSKATKTALSGIIPASIAASPFTKNILTVKKTACVIPLPLTQ